MAVSYSLVYQDAVSVPTAGATNYNISNPMPSGLIEAWGIQVTGTPAAAAAATTLSHLISQCRVTFNGNQWFNFNNIGAGAANVGPSRLGALVNDLGGQVDEHSAGPAGGAAGTLQDFTVWIPCGIQVGQNSRFEMALSYTAAASTFLATAGCNLTIWAKYGQSSSANIVGNMTSQTIAANAQTLVSVQIPTFANSKVAGIAIQGTNAADTLTSLIVKPLGDFAVTPIQLRGFSGAAMNGYQFYDEAVSVTANQFAYECQNYYFVPLYDLVSTDGNVNLLITTTAGGAANEVYYFSPVLKLPTGGSGERGSRQTASQKTGAAASILSRAEDSNA